MNEYNIVKVPKKPLSTEQLLKRKKSEVENLRKELDAARRHISKLLLNNMRVEEKWKDAIRAQQKIQLENNHLKKNRSN
jgi:hypothetical protein